MGVGFGTDHNWSFGANGKANIAESWDSRPFKVLPPKTRQSDVIKFARKVNIFKIFGNVQFSMKFCDVTLPCFGWKIFTKPGILWLGDIRLATGSKGSIEVWSKGQDHWCLHLGAFLALKAIRKLIGICHFFKYLVLCLCLYHLRWPRGLRLPQNSYASKVVGSRPSRTIFYTFFRY